jgi:glycosyltransferase involved in cell wall biosynthesis
MNPIMKKKEKKIENQACAILMGTFNGEKYIDEQISSIRKQDYEHIKIYISDDGSQDNTIKIIKKYQKLWGKDYINYRMGLKLGFAKNFLELLSAEDIKADYYAFADQDDIWQKDKISRAIRYLKKIPSNQPALYCARTKLVDVEGKEIGFSALYEKTPSFKNAIIQSIASGNTMVMNKAARELLSKTKHAFPVSHDWWSYLIISGAGHKIIYDRLPTIEYRQHDNNVVGQENKIIDRIKRISMLFKGRFKKSNDINIKNLQSCADLLSEENQDILKEFALARNKSLLIRIFSFCKLKLYRQTLFDNLGFIIAVILKKI